MLRVFRENTRRFMGFVQNKEDLKITLVQDIGIMCVLFMYIGTCRNNTLTYCLRAFSTLFPHLAW